MKAWQTNLERLGRRLGPPAGLAVLFALGGCSLLSPNEDEGDPEPNQAEYQVSVWPNYVTLTTNSSLATVNLSISCVGTNSPANCESNLEKYLNWRFDNRNNGISVTVTDSNAPSTTATLALTPSAFSDVSGSSSSLGGLLTSLMDIKFSFPTNRGDFYVQHPNLPLVMANNFIFPITVVFTGQQTQSYHTNQLELSTLNGATAKIGIWAWY